MGGGRFNKIFFFFLGGRANFFQRKATLLVIL